MNIVSVDPQARVLSEEEVLTLLREPIPMRLGMVDEKGWPLVTPVWHVFENDLFREVHGHGHGSVRRRNAEVGARWRYVGRRADAVALRRLRLLSRSAPTLSTRCGHRS